MSAGKKMYPAYILLYSSLFAAIIAQSSPFVKRITKSEGETVKLECSRQSAIYQAPENSPLFYRWLKEGVVLDSLSRAQYGNRYSLTRTNFEDDTLRIRSFQAVDAGNYSCQRATGSRTDKYYFRLYLDAGLLISRQQIRSTYNVTNGNRFDLLCPAHDEADVVFWTRKNNPPSKARTASRQTKLQFSRINSSDSGEYVCNAWRLADSFWSGHAPDDSITIRLNVIARDQKQPQIYVNADVGRVKGSVGSSLTVTCNVISFVPVTIKWLRLVRHPNDAENLETHRGFNWRVLVVGGSQTESLSRRQRPKNGHEALDLFIKQLSKSDAGEYMCVALNHNGNNDQELIVEVNEASVAKPSPELPRFLKRVGESLVLQCFVDHLIVQTDVAWFRNDELIHNGRGPELRIDHLNMKDAGRYRCAVSASEPSPSTVNLFWEVEVLENSAGTIDISVPPAPATAYEEGQNITLKCNVSVRAATADSAPKVRWLRLINNDKTSTNDKLQYRGKDYEQLNSFVERLPGENKWQSSVSLGPLKPSDSGTYACSALSASPRSSFVVREIQINVTAGRPVEVEVETGPPEEIVQPADSKLTTVVMIIVAAVLVVILAIIISYYWMTRRKGSRDTSVTVSRNSYVLNGNPHKLVLNGHAGDAAGNGGTSDGVVAAGAPLLDGSQQLANGHGNPKFYCINNGSAQPLMHNLYCQLMSENGSHSQTRGQPIHSAQYSAQTPYCSFGLPNGHMLAQNGYMFTPMALQADGSGSSGGSHGANLHSQLQHQGQSQPHGSRSSSATTTNKTSSSLSHNQQQQQPLVYVT